MRMEDFRVGDRVRSADWRLKSDRACTVTVVRDGDILSLRPDGQTRDVPVPINRGIRFARTDEPVPCIAPDAMDRWHVSNAAADCPAPEESVASFVTRVGENGHSFRMVSLSRDTMADARSAEPLDQDELMAFTSRVMRWQARYAGRATDLAFHHWVAWDVHHRPYGVSPQAYFAEEKAHQDRVSARIERHCESAARRTPRRLAKS